MMLLTPVYIIDWLIYGKNGIDARARLMMYDHIEKDGPVPDDVLKSRLLRALPLELGERFRWMSIVMTVVVGAVAVYLIGDKLALYQLPQEPVDYPLTIIRWWLLYLAASLIGTILTSLIALNTYSGRVSTHADNPPVI